MMNNITRKRERKKTEIAIFVCNITLLYLVTANYNIITKQRTTAGQPVTKQSGECWSEKKKTTAEKQRQRKGNLGGNQGQALLDHLTRPYIK